MMTRFMWWRVSFALRASPSMGDLFESRRVRKRDSWVSRILVMVLRSILRGEAAGKARVSLVWS